MLKNKKLFLIAEAGINHNGNLPTAIKLVDKAVQCKVMLLNFKHIKLKKELKKTSKIFNILKKV